MVYWNLPGIIVKVCVIQSKHARLSFDQISSMSLRVDSDRSASASLISSPGP
jgi:hypothetical protein